MANLMFPNQTGVLTPPQQQQLPYSMGTPVLQNPSQPPAKPKPALTAATGNARGSNRMPMYPEQQIQMGESLMRIGGAGLGVADQGGLAQMSAMAGAYGDVQDYNRGQALAKYQAEEDRRLKEQARQDALRKAAAAGAKGKKGSLEEAAKAMVSLQNAQAVLDGFDRRDGVVGWTSLFTRGWDLMTGDERENIRLKIESMKVDRVLANIARTKGAISEKEMEIFMSDQPAWYAEEKIWRKWVEDYIAALKVMNTNLANGTTVKDGASLPTTKTGTTTAPNQSTLDEADAIVNGS